MNLAWKGLIVLVDNFRNKFLVKYLSMIKNDPSFLRDELNRFSYDVKKIIESEEESRSFVELKKELLEMIELSGQEKIDKVIL